MNIDNVIIELKDDEGFVDTAYTDSLGFPTLGYGTKMPLTKLEATVILRMRLNNKIEELEKRKPLFKLLPDESRQILANMAYQLGVTGILGFKKMWKALEDRDFVEAAVQGLDSRWARQTPNRAHRLMVRMSKIVV